MRDTLRSWWQDDLLRGIVKNSSYLFTSNSAAIILSMLQGIFAARLLGAMDFGILAATVIPLVSNVNRLLSFRMSELVVKYTGQFLAEGKKDRVAALIKGALMTETATSVLAYLVLLLLAPLAATYLAKDPGKVSLFTLYGLVLLSNFTYETSLGVLQATNAFNRIALINLIQSVITASLILLAFLAKRGMLEVLLAYLLGKSFAGLMMSFLALRRTSQIAGKGWWKVPLSVLPDRGELIKFAISTNLSGTVNLVVRDSETLFITALRSPVEAGYFKIALGVINIVMLPIEPFIAPTYTEIARTIAQQDFSLTKRLLKRVSAISGSWTITTGFLLALFGSWLIPLMYGSEYLPAYPALLILLVGYGFANTLHWNRPLLLALGLPLYPLRVSGVIGVLKTALTLWLVPIYGYLVEAVILSAYFLSSIALIILRGIRNLNARLRLAADESREA
jgi:O-antigen/teichoic acid export membrane protein